MFDNDHRSNRPVCFRALLIALILVICLPAVAALTSKSVSAAAAPKKLKWSNVKKTRIMYAGTKKTFKLTWSPKTASPVIVWKSSKKSVVTVTQDGVVRALKPGKATVTAYVKGHKKVKVLCKITVKYKTPSKITWDNTVSKTLKAGQTVTRTATAYPVYAIRRAVAYKSSKKSVATVSSSGTVTAKKAGTAKITAYVRKYPSIRISYTVTVSKKISATSISFANAAPDVKKGGTYTNTATVYPSSATNKTLAYTSSDTSVATVNSAGRVSGVSPGAAVITAKATDGSGITASYTIVVLPSSAKLIAHRGYCAVYLQNTLEAFRAAGAAGFWGAETDIHRTKDGYYVCCHDNMLASASIDVTYISMKMKELGISSLDAYADDEETPIQKVNENGSLSAEYYTKAEAEKLIARAKTSFGSLSLAEIRSVPLANRSFTPTLEEYLTVCRQYGMVPVIELKGGFSTSTSKTRNTLNAADIQKIYSTVNAAMGSREYHFISFYKDDLTAMRSLIGTPSGANAHIRLEYLTFNTSDETLSVCKQYGFDLDVYQSGISDRSAVRKFQAEGLSVNAWTVTTSAQAAALRSCGVNYITANLPV